MAALERMNQDMDVRDVLSTIQVPTLILNRDRDPVAPIEAVRDMASRIPDARLLEFPGDSHIYYADEPADQAIFDALEEFVTGERPAAQARFDRVLTTVLFTDVVGSTQRAVSIGDRAWKQLLSHHHDLVRTELRRYRGREIDTAGDGFLATFDGPARAVRAAQAITQALAALELEVRAGVHTGEVELMGDQIGGIAVHIGARVAALAGPSEILVSSTVKDLTAGSGLRLEDAGEHELKGVPEPWHVYRLTAA
jgi:class 3 adenylate cyclase